MTSLVSLCLTKDMASQLLLFVTSRWWNEKYKDIKQ